jgi:hypothetical protein
VGESRLTAAAHHLIWMNGAAAAVISARSAITCFG